MSGLFSTADSVSREFVTFSICLLLAALEASVRLLAAGNDIHIEYPIPGTLFFVRGNGLCGECAAGLSGVGIAHRREWFV